MNVIANPIFTETEKTHLEFVLQYEFPERNMVIDQLNHIQEADIRRDVTPYYWIMEFRPGGVNPGYGPMHPFIQIEVRHDPAQAPSMFTLYNRNGYVFELEIYNADSSAMDLAGIMEGDIYIHSLL